MHKAKSVLLLSGNQPAACQTTCQAISTTFVPQYQPPVSRGQHTTGTKVGAEIDGRLVGFRGWSVFLFRLYKILLYPLCRITSSLFLFCFSYFCRRCCCWLKVVVPFSGIFFVITILSLFLSFIVFFYFYFDPVKHYFFICLFFFIFLFLITSFFLIIFNATSLH